MEYLVFNEQNNKLNLSVCSKDEIEINYAITNPDLLDLDKISQYQSLGIDIFNIHDQFFNDICVPYSINGSDVILKDRISDIYQNFSLCEDNCRLKGINTTTMMVSCICNVKSEVNEPKKDLKFDSIYTDLFTETSFGVIKCYKLVLDFKNKTKNIGFIIFSSLVLIHIPIFIYYAINGIFSINSYMMKEMEKFNYLPNYHPPKKKSIVIKEMTKISENSNSINNIKLMEKSKEKKLKISNKAKNKRKSKIEKRKTINENTKNDNDISIFMKKNKKNSKIILDDKKMIFSTEKLNIDNKASNANNYYLIRIDANNKINYISNESNHYLDNFDYDEALLYDKRSFCRIYYISLLSKNSILSTFILNIPLELKPIKYCLFIFMYSCDLALNTLFYFSENISDKYNYKGNNIIWFNIMNNLTISLASSIISFIIIFFLQFLTNSKDSYEEIFREHEDKMKQDKSYKINREMKIENIRKISKINKCLKVKLAFFIILEFSVMIFFYYFVSAFCEVYKNTQGSWIIDFLVSVVINFPIEI